MDFRQQKKLFLTLALGLAATTNIYADNDNDPCHGPTALMSIVDRPSVADSACTVPDNKVVVELGYQYGKLTSAGYQQNYPETEIRLGIKYNTEIFLFLPNYIHQSTAPTSGYANSFIGIKHLVASTDKWQTAITATFFPSSGSYAFGNNGSGATLNIVASYNATRQLNLTGQLGVSNQTTSSADGGQRFTTVNPDLILSYSLTDNLDIYAEVNGQSRTGPRQGSGFNSDGGLIYLLRQNMTVDIEAGQRISGALGSFNHYVGTGMAIEF